MERKKLKKTFSFMSWLRAHRDAEYERWRSDPLAYKAKQKRDAIKYQKEYERWKKEGKAV